MDINCPHCQQALGTAVVSRFVEGSRFQFTITPKDGTALDIGGIGDIFSSLHKALAAQAKAAGVRGFVAIVEQITQSEDGAITVDLIETVAKRKQKRKPEAAQPAD